MKISRAPGEFVVETVQSAWSCAFIFNFEKLRVASSGTGSLDLAP
jgi:hypothetical protein